MTRRNETGGSGQKAVRWAGVDEVGPGVGASWPAETKVGFFEESKARGCRQERGLAELLRGGGAAEVRERRLS